MVAKHFDLVRWTAAARRRWGNPGEAAATEQIRDWPVAYQLCRWPELPTHLRVAGVLRPLSMMSHRPVSPVWFARQSGWTVGQAQAFLDNLVLAGDAVARRITPAA